MAEENVNLTDQTKAAIVTTLTNALSAAKQYGHIVEPKPRQQQYIAHVPQQGNPRKFIQGNIAEYEAPTSSEGSSGSLASSLKPGSTGGTVDIVEKYKWTLSRRASEDIPYVRLREYKLDQTLLERQIKRYVSNFSSDVNRLGNKVSSNKGGMNGVLDVYDNIIPKNSPTGFTYKFPYFDKNAFQLNTTWSDMADAGDSAGKLPGIGEMISAAGNAVSNTLNLINVASEAATTKPGDQDKPKVFQSHQERTIKISFTLFNTDEPKDWPMNKEFIQVFITQNLFNKRDYVSGLPPVFYDVYIPGQYYSHGSTVSDIRVENLGNMRIIDGQIIPDAYQIEISLTEMVKPSKNQFEAIFTGEAQSNVETGIR